jgi:hypothetical protein
LALSLTPRRLAYFRLRRRWTRLPLLLRCLELRRRTWLVCAPGSLRAFIRALLVKIRGSSADDRKLALLVILLGVIIARHFSSPAASLLASRWARLRAALLRFALRLVRMLGVGASRVSMAASVAEPQLAAAVVGE